MGRKIVGAPRKKPTKNAQAVRIGNLIYTQGIPVNFDTGEVVGKSIREQTKQTMENIRATLEGCGSSMDNIDKCTAFISGRDLVAGMNEVYYTYFPADSTPARVCVIAELVNPQMMVEIEVYAHLKDE
ncbi:MAG: RidA family protein [Desulfobacteraceae bacterium]|nr:MAG: RidA family protein [Desulfobacteraceae bacterium]